MRKTTDKPTGEIDDRPLFTRPEVAKLLGVHPDTIRYWGDTGKLRDFLIGYQYLIPRDEVVRLRRERGIE